MIVPGGEHPVDGDRHLAGQTTGGPAVARIVLPETEDGVMATLEDSFESPRVKASQGRVAADTGGSTRVRHDVAEASIGPVAVGGHGGGTRCTTRKSIAKLAQCPAARAIEVLSVVVREYGHAFLVAGILPGEAIADHI